jgi:hypothetical protein
MLAEPITPSCGSSNNAERDQHVLLGKLLRITCDGGAFVPRGIWPAAYDGAYLFS